MKTYRQKHPYIAQIGYILRYKLQRFTWMFKVKDCRRVCSANIMTHADRRAKANEHEICNEK